MQVPSARLPLLSILLAAATVPAMAGNYAEGDPRPIAMSGMASGAAVAAEARAWMATASTGGYPEGNPRAAAQANENSRARVRAETMNWINSGLSSLQYGEAGTDQARSAYAKTAPRQAALGNF